MRRSRSGYSGYRGRRTLHDILKWIAAVLAVLVVLLVAVLLFGQPFIVFTDGGPRVDLPSLVGGGEAPPEQPGSISVVVDTGTGELTAEDVAKITDIAMTETGYPASGIKIMASN